MVPECDGLRWVVVGDGVCWWLVLLLRVARIGTCLVYYSYLNCTQTYLCHKMHSALFSRSLPR